MSVGAVLMLAGLTAALAVGSDGSEPRPQRTVRYDESAFDPALLLLDVDDDTVPDVRENKVLSTDRLILDSDEDGKPDAWESFFGLDPNYDGDAELDPDRDGLSNLEEFEQSVKSLEKRGFSRVFDPAQGLDPLNKDTDGDQLPDGWEIEYGLDPLQASGLNEDLDGDSLTNLEEYHAGSDPKMLDTDGDTLDDGKEVRKLLTDPTKPDTDDDGLPDWWEDLYSLQPLNPNDRFADPDDDGLVNLFEYQHDTDPTLADTDSDGIPDGWEVKFGLDPTQFADGQEDLDADGLSNLGEYQMRLPPDQPGGSVYQQSTDPKIPDSDGDGLLDGDEKRYGTNPFQADTDLDGLSDGDEIHVYFTNPLTKDTDGDGLADGREIKETLTRPTIFDSDSDGVDDGTEWLLWEERMKTGREALQNSGFLPGIIIANFPGATVDEQVRQMGPHGDLDVDGLLNILDEDADADGIFDGQEWNLPASVKCATGSGTDPANPDTDGDRMPDGWEVNNGLDACDASDAEKDPDHDGVAIYGRRDPDTGEIEARIRVSPMGPNPASLNQASRQLPEGYTVFLEQESFRFTNVMEYQNGTRPLSPDSDCDVLPDGWEVLFQKVHLDTGLPHPNPSEFDSDQDPDDDGYDHQGGDDGGRDGKRTDSELFTNLEEWYFFTAPWENDTDEPWKPNEDEQLFVVDGAEVYLTMVNRSMPDPTPGLRNNGADIVQANLATELTFGASAGCHMDYRGLPWVFEEEAAGPAPAAEDGFPPAGGLALLVLAALVLRLELVPGMSAKP